MPQLLSMRRRALLAVLACFAPLLLCVLQPAEAAPTPVTVMIGGKSVPFGVTPFVGSDGQVWAPVDAVRLMGASFAPTPGQFTVTITGADGHSFTTPYIPQQGHECVALQKVALQLGASADWQPTTTTLTLRARLEMVRQNSDALAIYTSYPVPYQVQHIGNPSRIFVDMYGLDLAAAPASVPVVDTEGAGANVERIRSGQIDYNTVRITVDLKQDMGYQVTSRAVADNIQVALGGDAPPAPTQVVASNPPLPVQVQNPLPPTLPKVAPGNGVRITAVSVRPLSDAVTQIAITATGAAKYRTETLRGPNRLAFDLAGAQFEPSVNSVLPGVGSVIKTVRAGILRTGVANFGRIVVDLSQLVGFTVNTEPGEGGAVTYLLNLQTGARPSPGGGAPPGGNSLAGKVVAVDPGHGLQDTGALSPDGSCEKDMTLAIGLKLRDVLRQNGATVIMTRADDSFLPVMARAQFAADHNADYFISIHCDSVGRGWTNLSGTTVYFHGQNSVCQTMARDIVNRVAEVSGLPANGVKSDFIRFPGIGFGVLRGSPMPAVLVECGYMNNAADLPKLKDDATRQQIANGIAAGLRDFIADRSASR